jgi:UDP-N-acetyl-D-glucosamine/UDP-N-acetyl-D-galactosamine dehydrogenase
VPDIRNTRVIDIVRELKDYQIDVQIFDPLADPAEARHEYGVELTPESELRRAHALVFAVAHRAFLERGWEGIRGLLADGRGVVMDVKGRLPRERVPDGVTLWRL